MKYQVVLTHDAERDLEEIHSYISNKDSIVNADHVLDQLLRVADNLADFPEKGAYLKELNALGIQEYRQTFFKPYRVIYRIHGQQVVVYVIADGRRDMQTLLSRRLLSG